MITGNSNIQCGGSYTDEVSSILDKASAEATLWALKQTHNVRRLHWNHDNGLPKIKKVIFNDPATIVFWKDGTKTVVKCQDGDIFDEEKGLAMAISKKSLGNDYDYYKVFKKHCKGESDHAELYADGKLYTKIFNNISLMEKYINSDVNLIMDKGEQHG